MRTFDSGLRVLAAVISLTAALQSTSLQAAGCGCSVCAGGGGAGCGPAEYQLIERTINVPTMVTERRVVQVTECRLEQRQRTVNVSRVVPETRQVTETYTVMVPEVRVRKETYHVRKPVWREVDQTVTVQVPQQETRQAVRHVCRQVQVEELRTVSRDQGQWEDILCEAPHGHSGGSGCGNGGGASCGRCCRRLFFRGCGGCGGCGGGNGCGNGCGGGYDAGSGPAASPHIHRVWRPNIVTEQVPVMVWRNQMVEEPYEYTVTVYRPEQRTQRVKVCEYVTEELSRDVQFTVCVAQQRSRVRDVTTYKTVIEPRVETFSVEVPHTVSKEVDVAVCRMVPRQVVMRVPVYYGFGGCSAYGGGPGCGGACGRCP